MSFVRFGIDGSQIQMFRDVRGPVVCWSCHLTPVSPTGWAVWAVFETTELDVMLAHLAEHRAAGHVVPAWLDADLRADWHEDDPCLHACSINTPCVVHQRRTGHFAHRCADPAGDHCDHRCACGQPWSSRRSGA